MALGAGDKFGLRRAFLKPRASGSGGRSKVDRRDSQAEAKAKRFRSLRRVVASTSALRRAKTTSKSRSIVNQLRHTTHAPIHPLWSFLPSDTRTRQSLLRLRRQRLWAWLKQKRQRTGVVVLVYLLIWSAPLLIGEPLLSAFAVLPLILVPPVGYLVYWLVWKEFHA